jgi:hypothetical protein
MKKLYAIFAILITLGWTQFTFAQTGVTNCPGPSPAVATPVSSFDGNGVETCRIIGQGLPLGAPVSVYNAAGELIGQGFADNSGFACIFYPCDQIPTVVCAFVPDGCCFAIIAPPVSLPIKLTDFNARLQSDNTVRLNWTSAFEVNNYKYELEKSTDGRNFHSVATIAGAGTSLRSLNYSEVDNSFASDQPTFYRLKQIDVDGRFEYSAVVYVNNRRTSGRVTGIFPNPFRNSIQLVGINTRDLNADNVKVYNTNGQRIAYKVVGTNAIAIDQGAQNGVYIVRIKDQVFKVVKE